MQRAKNHPSFEYDAILARRACSIVVAFGINVFVDVVRSSAVVGHINAVAVAVALVIFIVIAVVVIKVGFDDDESAKTRRVLGAAERHRAARCERPHAYAPL
jgi:hypothetical protein